jgi:DNA-binding NtrC family response regulator
MRESSASLPVSIQTACSLVNGDNELLAQRTPSSGAVLAPAARTEKVTRRSTPAPKNDGGAPAGERPLRRTAALSGAMQRALEVLERLAAAEVTVTLMGETGTGKDVLARHVHQRSRRARGAFVVFDCGSVAANLAESELLGHERGAFTGATSAHVGAFERANGGTLFLDEIGELPLDLQPRLLRVLENRSVRRVGGTVDRLVDVRIVAATNRDLQAEVAAGRFRQDLFFRLAAAVVQVPPLRERCDDIPLLVARLLDDLGHPGVGVSADTLRLLRSRSWPGNVRELKNVLACALAFLDSEVIEPRHLASLKSEELDAPLSRVNLWGQTLESLEREAIHQTLQKTRGNKAQAAHALGIAVSTLYEKLKKYRLSST